MNNKAPYTILLVIITLTTFCTKHKGDEANVIIKNNMIQVLDGPISELKEEIVSGNKTKNKGQYYNHAEYKNVLSKFASLESYHIPLMKANSYLFEFISVLFA